MSANRWLDRTQPQTLFMAVILLYVNAAFLLLSGLVLLPVAVGGVAAGYGIANEKKWGYGLGIAMAVLPFVLQLVFLGNPFATNLINLMFEIALLALLLHPQSREYQRIWFK
jgi:hypothetical protein